MPIGIGANPVAVAQAYPGAAQKGQMDPRQLEKQGNEQLETRGKEESTAVASRQKPVQSKDDTTQARMEDQQKAAQEQKALLDGGQAMKLEKQAGRLSIYA